jgi:uncharacterized protein YjbI with pentapeptide repeats
LVESNSEKLLEALEKSSSHNGRQLAVFLSAQIYLLVMVASTTDLQLLLGDSKIKLPILGVELPLFGFYIVAPALLLVLHFSLLLSMLHHARKLQAWDESTTDDQKLLLPGFILNYAIPFKAGTLNYTLMRLLQVITLCVFPLLMLLCFQIRFADYHSIWMTGWHFLLVLLDIFVLVVYWYRISYPKFLDRKYDEIWQLLTALWKKQTTSSGSEEHGEPPRARNRLARWHVVSLLSGALTYNGLLAIVAVVSTLWLAVVVMICSDYFDGRERYVELLPRISAPGERLVNAPSDVILQAYIGRGQNVDSASEAYAQGIDLNGRDLRLANLSGANMARARLDRAILNSAELNDANLSSASLVWAKLNRAMLWDTKMDRIILKRAELNGASLWGTRLNGADLRRAELNGADLRNAELNGAYLREAQLNGAFLFETQLNGADLRWVQLNGANLEKVKLNGASLAGAMLNCASLIETEMDGADLFKAQLHGTLLSSVKLNGSYIEQARLSGCTGLDPSVALGVYFEHAVDTVSRPDWDYLRARASLVPFATSSGLVATSRLDYLLRIDSGMARFHRADTSSVKLIPDSASFVRVRRDLANREIWTAYGMLWQTCYCAEIGRLLPAQSLLESMCDSCRDSLEAVRARAVIDDRDSLDTFLQRRNK